MVLQSSLDPISLGYAGSVDCPELGWGFWRGWVRSHVPSRALNAPSRHQPGLHKLITTPQQRDAAPGNKGIRYQAGCCLQSNFCMIFSLGLYLWIYSFLQKPERVLKSFPTFPSAEHTHIYSNATPFAIS